MAEESVGIIGEAEAMNLQQLEDYFKLHTTHKKVADLVKQFSTVFGLGWFTLDDCLTIFKEASVEQLVDIVKTLHLCGFLIVNEKKEGLLERFRLSSNSIQNMDDILGKQNNS